MASPAFDLNSAISRSSLRRCPCTCCGAAAGAPPLALAACHWAPLSGDRGSPAPASNPPLDGSVEGSKERRPPPRDPKRPRPPSAGGPRSSASALALELEAADAWPPGAPKLVRAASCDAAAEARSRRSRSPLKARPAEAAPSEVPSEEGGGHSRRGRGSAPAGTAAGRSQAPRKILSTQSALALATSDGGAGPRTQGAEVALAAPQSMQGPMRPLLASLAVALATAAGAARPLRCCGPAAAAAALRGERPHARSPRSFPPAAVSCSSSCATCHCSLPSTRGR